MEPSHEEFPPSTASFDMGTSVRLYGLERSELNYHIGRVVEPRAPNNRVGVTLHSVLWQDEAVGDRNGNSRCRSRSRPRSAAHDKIIAVRPENLRLIHDPRTLPEPQILGCPSASVLSRLLGEHGLGFPDPIPQDVAKFLSIPWASSVKVVGSSSSRGDYPLDAVLDRDESTWWISESETMPCGYGEEWLEFSFGETPRRISFVGVRIPPLPYGPLSVREFHLSALSTSGSQEWVDVGSECLLTLNRGDMQEFAIVPPAETTRLRLVCTRNAAASPEAKCATTECVGLFEVRFL